MQRRKFIGASAAALAAAAAGGASLARPARRKPNFIVIYCDDLGYGDIEPMGGKTIPTPHLARMAREGMVLTDYYAPANICTPSRAGLLTGRYPIRTGLAWNVILQNDKRMLPLSEVTIPRALKPAGYASALVGKWHLGHMGPDWSPTRHGFDRFFGIPYSHDMQPLSLYTDDGTGEPQAEPVVYDQLQQRFLAAADAFITENADKPFFLDLALSAPHLPNDPAPAFKGKSPVGSYVDEVMEVDAIVGRLMARLRELKLDRDTLVLFTSDNGPWVEGSAAPLRDRKGGAGYDGGYRVPFIAWMPGTVPAGKRVDSIAMGIDVLPTLCAMADTPLPEGVELDGKDISAVLTRGAPSPHDDLLLFNDEDVVAVRTQRWKYVNDTHYHGYLIPMAGWKKDLTDQQQLYDMARSPDELYSAAAREPEVADALKTRIEEARAYFGPMRTRPSGLFSAKMLGQATAKQQD